MMIIKQADLNRVIQTRNLKVLVDGDNIVTNTIWLSTSSSTSMKQNETMMNKWNL